MDLQTVSTLIDKFTSSALTSLKYHDENFDLELTQAAKEDPIHAQQSEAAAPIMLATAATEESTAVSAATPAVTEPVDETELITAPVVGTFYIAPTSTEAPYVVVGAEVEPGQQVGIVQAMQVMRPVITKQAGEIVEILVQNGAEVSYGQPLMKLKPESAATPG